MSGPAETTPTALSPGRAAAAAEQAMRLTPDDPFPDILVDLPLERLQVLHSRICRQLDHEYLTSPEGRHPMTLDRLLELQDEFDSRLLP